MNKIETLNAAEGLSMRGAIYNNIMARHPELIPKIKSIVQKELSEKYGTAPMIAPMSALITEAYK